MEAKSAVRDAIRTEIKSITAELAKLERMLRQLDGDDGLAVSAESAAPTATRTKRLRLNDDVAAKISHAIVKAVKAHRNGASRGDIVEYLARSGWTAGHHYNDPHLNRLVTALLGIETPAIRREGTKGSTRYHAV